MRYLLNAEAIDALEEPEARRMLKATTAGLAVMLARQRAMNSVSNVVLKRAGNATVEIESSGGAVMFRLVGETNSKGGEPPVHD